MMTSLIIHAINILNILKFMEWVSICWKILCLASININLILPYIQDVIRNIALEMPVKRVYEPTRLMEKPLSMDYWP